jgi:tripartite-type tricarboxylate transporter receptor subunit TctC
MPPGVKPEEVAYYIDLFKRVRETPEWKEFMEKGAFNQSFMTGAEYQAWLEIADSTHRQLMKEAGFLAN